MSTAKGDKQALKPSPQPSSGQASEPTPASSAKEVRFTSTLTRERVRTSLKGMNALTAGVDLKVLSLPSKAAMREVLHALTNLSADLNSIELCRSEVLEKRARVAALEVELAKARTDLERSQARLWTEKGAATEHGYLAEYLVDGLKAHGSAIGELLEGFPVGTFADAGDLLATWERLSNPDTD